MKIIHDFFSQNGGGENLILSISDELNLEIFTAFNTLKKNNLVKESIFSSIIKRNQIFVFLYYFFIFNIKSKEPIIFSGNHCCFSIKKCTSSRKYLYAHSLPKSLYSNLYLGYKTNIFMKISKKFVSKIYYKNLLALDGIYFNSIKTKNKFLEVFPDLKINIPLNILYPYSNMPFIENNFQKNIKRKYFVINSRHKGYKNIIELLLIIKSFFADNKDLYVYVTHNGDLDKNLKELNLPDNFIFTGYLKFEHYKNLLSNSIGIIFPSRDEDFGISALDAYNLDIPVIIREECGFVELLQNEYEFFFDDSNLISVLKKICNNKIKSKYNNRKDYKKIFLKQINNLKI